MMLGFILNSILLGVGLAMDAFSVSVADGLKSPNMKRSRRYIIAGIFAFFQFMMPLLGWIGVRSIVLFFGAFEKVIPWIAMGLLVFIGSKMICEGVTAEKNGDDDRIESADPGVMTLVLQGVATSIDALSVGFTIADYGIHSALTACSVIAVVTFCLSLAGVRLGRKLSSIVRGKASIFGGAILICIGFEIFIKGIWFQ